MGNEYGDEQKEYIIRKNMKLSQGQWDVSIYVIFWYQMLKNLSDFQIANV